MSLVEVLVALTILAFALLGLMPLFAGAVKTAASANQLTSANGAGWYVYPYVRTYTVEQFGPLPVPVGGPTLVWMTTPVTAPSGYAVKLVTVTVRPTRGPFPGLRQTTQSLYLRFPNG